MKLFSHKKRKQKTNSLLIDNEMPFAVQEAYKLLRTNIMFSIAEEKCKTIVVTSSVQGEGKSVTSINLAYALAKNNMKVLLIDCDLRLPTIAQKMNLPNKPGLTNFLYSGVDINRVIQKIEKDGLYVIPAGDTPPNPSESLGSVGMKKLLEVVEKVFDYIILDTPPVCTVTDASILAKRASGVVLVVRQGVATFESVDSALAQLKISDANVLGTVITGTIADKKAYKKYGYGYERSNTRKSR